AWNVPGAIARRTDRVAHQASASAGRTNLLGLYVEAASSTPERLLERDLDLCVYVLTSSRPGSGPCKRIRTAPSATKAAEQRLEEVRMITRRTEVRGGVSTALPGEPTAEVLARSPTRAARWLVARVSGVFVPLPFLAIAIVELAL